MQVWLGDFGESYLERNDFETDEEFNEIILKRHGRTRDDINQEWLADIPRDSRILEIGANIGNQLRALKRIGFKHLYGVELQRRAVDRAKEVNPGIDIVEGSAFDVPFKDGFFDFVFTNNVLIHFAPDDVTKVMDEMYRLSNKYIWGFEPYAKEFTVVNYREHESLMWKADYCGIFLERFKKLRLVRDELFDFLDDPGKQDRQYILERS